MRFLTAGPEILSQTGTGNIFGTIFLIINIY